MISSMVVVVSHEKALYYCPYKSYIFTLILAVVRSQIEELS